MLTPQMLLNVSCLLIHKARPFKLVAAMVEDSNTKHHGKIVLMRGLGKNLLLAVAASMIVARTIVTTTGDCLIKIGQKCFCAVHEIHPCQVSFNEALPIGAANSSVSEIVRKKSQRSKAYEKSTISQNFRNNEAKTIEKNKKQKHQRNQRHQHHQKNQAQKTNNKESTTQINTT